MEIISCLGILTKILFQIYIKMLEVLEQENTFGLLGLMAMTDVNKISGMVCLENLILVKKKKKLVVIKLVRFAELQAGECFRLDMMSRIIYMKVRRREMDYENAIMIQDDVAEYPKFSPFAI